MFKRTLVSGLIATTVAAGSVIPGGAPSHAASGGATDTGPTTRGAS